MSSKAPSPHQLQIDLIDAIVSCADEADGGKKDARTLCRDLVSAVWKESGQERDTLLAEIRQLRAQLAARPPLFQQGPVQLHSGDVATWKIDCDALTEADLATLAAMLVEILPPFGVVEGVPRGGVRLAQMLGHFMRASSSSQLLIVDDVCTTGASLEQQRNGRAAIGAVLFARGPCASWVTPLFTHQAVVRAQLAAQDWQPDPRKLADVIVRALDLYWSDVSGDVWPEKPEDLVKRILDGAVPPAPPEPPQ